MKNKKRYYIGLITVVVLLMSGCMKANASEEVSVKENTEVNVQIEKNISDELSKRSALFMSAEALNILEDENLIILDARGEDAYKGGHIPGALMTSWQSLSTMDVEFATTTWGSVTDKDALSKAISALGIDETSKVVIYADTEKGWGEEGRLYWTLKMAGLEDVRLLDGGINVWNDLEYGLTTEPTLPVMTEFNIATLNKTQTIDTASLSASLLDYKVIDTRDLDEYEGAVKFGEARGGHLPGAIHLGYKSLLNDKGTLKSNEDLLALFESAGITKEDAVVAYCTAGIRSAYVVEILDMLGYETVMNYDESFYVWANTPDLKLGKVVKGKAYNYYTQEDLKKALENKVSMLLVDIQVEEDYQAHHIEGVIETNAFPVKTDEERQRLEAIAEEVASTTDPIVIVCPRGGGGAQRTVDYLKTTGVPSAQLYILEKGQEGWPYDEFLSAK